MNTCKLWRANMFMLFPTDQIWMSRKTLDSLDNERRAAVEHIIEDVQAKGRVPWTQRMPLHECADCRVHVDPINGFAKGHWSRMCVCNTNGGMSHCESFEKIMSANYGQGPDSSRVFGTQMTSTVTLDSNNVVFPIHLQGNLEGSMLEGSMRTQESVHVRVASGLYNMRNFAGVQGLNATLRYVVIKDCFFCPLASEIEPVHDCTVHGCASHDPYTGFATCCMTAITLNMSEAMRAQDEYAKVNRANTWTQERDAINRLKRSVMRSDNDLARGVTREDISKDRELREDLEHYAQSSTSAFGRKDQSRSRLHNVRRNGSKKMTCSERREKKSIMKVIGRISERGESSSALKIINTGHLSSAKDYMNEAIYRLQISVGTGIRARSAMTRYLTRVIDSGKKVAGENSMTDDGVRVIKKYTIPEREDAMRRMAEEAERTKGVRVNIVVLRDNNGLIKMINEQLRKVAHNALVFWIILRVRTTDGANDPNLIAFSSFALAFAYMMRDGYSLRSKNGDEETLLPTNRFLQYVLPEMSLLDSIDHVLSEKDTSNCMRNIKRILKRHCVTESNPCADISPFAAHNAEMDIDEVQKRRPDIFEGLRRRRRTNR
jgi:hypothetical protein